MKKSVEEFESLLKVRSELKQLKKRYEIPPAVKYFLEVFGSTQDPDKPASIIISERVMTRISESNNKILDEELKALDVEIAAYNDAFKGTESK